MNSIIEYLLDNVDKYPSRIALIDNEHQISYELFWKMASQIDFLCRILEK